ncbi:MAG: sigma-54-dependent Fis family transcriptional regulator [Methylophaga sp.]|uniref:sigma 54-interacting transcriptional regulator n=1 Tax=Methylophaga sp. UBA678 TaxID=1946901 RepID=UPI000C5F7CB6|nr:sigma-54 dependent transcriptional regulator [Methylophaga sp. UBA678]MAX50734.1 sigma-54-dependent Fis family transcriptional regulator [Methylophaga sp.]|tara:strand:+ start:30397 stop:31323 length:927 start_codon:yes stop_codon:yes gene_type:complete
MNDILGQSPDLTHILRTLPMIALSDASVLISGETGTGKELIALSLHEQSRRRDNALITINCAALPTEEVELDLFGRSNEQGEITFRGRLLAAEGGTVFLDEVDALPLSVQAKVLRFLEAGECQLQGSHRLHVADVRILAATSADLPAEVKAGRFRPDLFYRLQVVPIELPALRDRSEDISLLMRHYLKVYAGNNAVVRLSKEAEQSLLHYSWPGNIRELQNLCQRLALLHPGELLQPGDLPREMRPEVAIQQHQFVLPASGIDLAKVELDLIEQALDMAAGNRSKAARMLGISRDTLLYRMQKYNLSP